MNMSQSSSSDVLVVDEVVFKEKNIYDDDCDPWTAGPSQTTLCSQYAPDHDDASFYAKRSHQEPQIPRHERKRRLQALEKAYEEDSESSSPSSTPPDRSDIGNGSNNPFAALETLITLDKNYKQRHPASNNASQEISSQLDSQHDTAFNSDSTQGKIARSDRLPNHAKGDSQLVEGLARIHHPQNLPSAQDSTTNAGVDSLHQGSPAIVTDRPSTFAHSIQSCSAAVARPKRFRDTKAAPNPPNQLVYHQDFALLDQARRPRQPKHRETRPSVNVASSSQPSRSNVVRAPSIVGSRYIITV